MPDAVPHRRRRACGKGTALRRKAVRSKDAATNAPSCAKAVAAVRAGTLAEVVGEAGGAKVGGAEVGGAEVGGAKVGGAKIGAKAG